MESIRSWIKKREKPKKKTRDIECALVDMRFKAEIGRYDGLTFLYCNKSVYYFEGNNFYRLEYPSIDCAIKKIKPATRDEEVLGSTLKNIQQVLKWEPLLERQHNLCL
jgi:hypothetical protein